tara:strand:- start:405 stop:572 length:168 start_codon:yes stop_codon:yes gene_type:complete
MSMIIVLRMTSDIRNTTFYLYFIRDMASTSFEKEPALPWGKGRAGTLNEQGGNIS